MPINPDKLWADMAGGLRRKLGLKPLSYEEAVREYESVKGVPLSYDEVQHLVHLACGHKTANEQQPPQCTMTDHVDRSHVTEEMLVLNRNAGEKDQAIEDRLRSLREKALEKKRASDAKENADGLDGGTEQTRKSK